MYGRPRAPRPRAGNDPRTAACGLPVRLLSHLDYTYHFYYPHKRFHHPCSDAYYSVMGAVCGSRNCSRMVTHKAKRTRTFPHITTLERGKTTSFRRRPTSFVPRLRSPSVWLVRRATRSRSGSGAGAGDGGRRGRGPTHLMPVSTAAADTH